MLKELFGGAVTAALPDSWLDASTIRVIPDNQEVYIDPENQLNHIIIEILETVSKNDEYSIGFHFKDLCNMNNAKNVILHYNCIIANENIPNIESNIYKAGLISNQQIGRFQNRDVITYMSLFRLPQVRTDFLISLNITLPTELPKKEESIDGKDGKKKSVNLDELFQFGEHEITSNTNSLPIFHDIKSESSKPQIESIQLGRDSLGDDHYIMVEKHIAEGNDGAIVKELLKTFRINDMKLFEA
ncbi:MAG: putative ran guanine nucleotide release factor [Streblomastix strix]|uniref:Putative ran guanine nucleotide release factor n=1 Tax=Streblomastix strix TaxID=222440 RepID=A0A5J4W291_9EUKA|nr:MAG: putative ran guanine nucleotide release factor [Streblomastix strix]